MRPQFHFTATSGWINDPHGITYRGGYDVFYQYVPGTDAWAPNCHWGHARGADLLSLTELPVALAPGDGDDGIWTGSLAVDDAGDARIFYTATSVPDFGIGRIRLATPADDQWREWVKGPVVVQAPRDLDLIAYRDPFIRREGSSWRMFVGAGDSRGTAMALTYVSDDGATSWRYDGIALSRSTDEREPVWMGALWECPQVFPLGDRWVMVSSVWDADTLHYAAYALGDFAGGRFHAETWGRLTYGSSYYAPSLYQDAEGRPCLSFWMRGVRDPGGAWASTHSLPHLLSIEGERLIATPHPDVSRYRAPLVEGEQPDALDIEWRPAPGDRLIVRRGDLLIAELARLGETLRIGVGDEADELPAGIDVRVTIDGPVLEVATSGGIAGQALPVPEGALGVEASGGNAQVFALRR